MAEQQGVGPTTPDPDVAPALPLHPTMQWWRSSPRFVTQLGSWAHLQAFSFVHSWVGAADVLSDALQRVSYVHTCPSTCCGVADSPLTPSSKHEEGGGGEEVAEQQGVGPTTPDPDVAPALPLHPAMQWWRSSPRFVTQLGKRRAPSPALLEERPRKERALNLCKKVYTISFG